VKQIRGVHQASWEKDGTRELWTDGRVWMRGGKQHGVALGSKSGEVRRRSCLGKGTLKIEGRWESIQAG